MTEPPQKTTAQFVFTISRVFDAPKDRVWEAWTDERKLAKWFGHKGSENIYTKLDFREGGYFHYGLSTPQGMDIWGKWSFKEIVKAEKLVFIVTFTDPEGKKVTRHPLQQIWPLEVLSTVTFKEIKQKTEVTVNWQAHNATDAEEQRFEDNQQGMHFGWSGVFESLEDFLKG